MTEDEVLAEFRASNALLEGHFLSHPGATAPIICNAPAC
jgi:hypothetical protein